MRLKTVSVLIALALATSAIAVPTVALADGGPILTDPQLWAQLKEGQQTAVVTFTRSDVAHIDLFVSMLDDTGESHEVVYFVPLGIEPSDFDVKEASSLDFDRQLTELLDARLRERADDRNQTRLYLLGVTSAISGGWMLPLYIPIMLTGCAAAPEATFETASSSVSIYGLDQDTNLDDLINTTGLDPSVKETLSRLSGQRIAVITLQTRPTFPGKDGSSSYPPRGQPGIHLSWTSTLARESGTATYSYPLGTGSAWSHPIDLTRVYVVAPPGLDFTVRYPRLGDDRSGYNLAFMFGQDRPRIVDYYNTPAYAIDDATGSFGRIWRATYSRSNSSEDVVIQTGSQGILVRTRQFLGGLGGFPSLLIGLLVAAVFWVAAWRYVMPQMIGARYEWRGWALWGDALSCLGINASIAVISAFMAAVVGVIGLALGGSMLGFFGAVPGLLIALLVVIPSLFGVPAIWLYLRRKWRYTDWPGKDTSFRRVVAAYIVVALAANVTYLVFIIGYTAMIGIL